MDLFKKFEEETPNEFVPLRVKLVNGVICNGYYVNWSNTVYLAFGSPELQAIEWCYRELHSSDGKNSLKF